MAGDIKSKYGTTGVSMTITLTGLLSGAGRVATAVDNTTNLYDDAAVFLKTKTGTVSGNKQLLAYAVGSNDNGTTYTDNVGGTDAAVSTQPPSAVVVKGVSNLASTTSYYLGPFWIGWAFQGNKLPDHWSIVLWDDGAGTLSATATDHAMTYEGVYGQYT